MASFPGRLYYGPSLSNPSEQPTIWSNSPSRDFYRQQYHPARTALGLGLLGLGLAKAGNIPLGGRGRVWDYYVRGIRAAEEYSPGGILRTFQLSNFFSQFETATQDVRISSNLLQNNPIYTQYLHNLLGGGVAKERLLRQGVHLKNGRLFWGNTQDVALKYAVGIRSSPYHTASWIGKSWAAMTGIDPLIRGDTQSFFTKEFPDIWQPNLRNPMAGDMATQIIGAKSRIGLDGQHINALATEWVGRFNRLLAKPAELPLVGSAFHGLQRATKKYLGRELNFAVKSGTASQMMTRLVGKYGLVLPAAYLGYKTLDWGMNGSRITKGSIFEEGLTTGIATAGVKTHIAVSRLAEITGLHKYREKQEEIAPGSTSLQKLLAFPIIGSLTAEGGLYAIKTGKMLLAQYRNPALESWQARQLVEEEMKNFGGKSIISRAAKYVARSDGIFSNPGRMGNIWRRIAEKTGNDTELSFKLLGKMTPAKFAGAFGMLAGITAVLPFIPGALIPGKRPDELEAEYSGRKEVAVRPGRFWEMGKCLTKSTTCKLYDGLLVPAEQIQCGNILVGRNGLPTQVLNVFTRHYQGRILKFSAATNRDVTTTLTPNHIVPILKNDVIVEVPAEEIQVGTFVEIPFQSLNNQVETLNPLDYIKSPVIIQNNRIYSSQINWFTHQLQKSGTTSIPTSLSLDGHLGKLFGYYLAEGNISFKRKNPTMVEFVFARHEQWLVDDVIRLSTEKFGVVPTVRLKMTGAKVKNGCWIVRICSAIVARLFQSLFYPAVYDKDLKNIPSVFLQATNDFKLNLIEGYWRGDGWIDNNSRIIGSTHKSLLEDIQLIAFNLDIPCGISLKEDNGYDGDWSLRFSSSTQWGRLKFINGRLFSRINTIEEQDYDDMVYDFEVDSDDHLFQAGTFLVHNSAYEGTKVGYYRPNWYAKMRMHARDSSIWGNADLKNKSPIRRWFEQEFTYKLESKHYVDRPYPISSLPFQDVPFIGPILANTIGRLIKPPRLMHTEEWKKGDLFQAQPSRFGEHLAREMGEIPAGKPISPYDARATIGEEWMRTYEMAGLPGFIASSIKERITGSGDIFDQMSQLESARRMFGFERQYYESELGGALGMSEAFRRLYPHRNRAIPLYNPIANNMPDWLPGPGDKSPDFLHGDPFTKVPEGELRLPGEGYAQRFPELAGLSPADYPLIHKWKILADVAPYSEKFGQMMNEVRSARKSREWTPAQEQIYQTTIEQIASRKQKKVFQEYQYLSPMGNIFQSAPKKLAGDSTNLLGTLNRIKADQQEKPGVSTKLFGGYWELLSHNAETVMDQLTPMSPGAKLVHQRTAIEDYERTRLYGSENAFWGHPIRDFLRPTAALAAHDIGYQGVPSYIESRRNLESYFDILKYVKNTRLANIARASNDYDAAKEFEAKKDQTLFGINPYTMNYTSIFNALPRKERDYFNAFVAADTPEERTRILQMVPENEKALYAARWKLTFADEVKKASKNGKLSEDQMTEAENILSHIYADAHSEGMPNDKELQAQYIQSRKKDESYGDWYRRTHLLTQVKNLPGPNWIGFHPSVDLDDIKLKVVQTTGEDMHDYDLWESRAQLLANKSYINQEAIQPLINPEQLSQAEMHSRIDELLSMNNLQGDVFIRGKPGPNDRIDVDIQTPDNNQDDIMKSIG